MKGFPCVKFAVVLLLAAVHYVPVSPVVQSKSRKVESRSHSSTNQMGRFVGPSFTSKFPRKILSLNTEVTLVPCTVHGRPAVAVEWLWYDEVTSQAIGGASKPEEVYTESSSNWVPVAQSTSGLLEQLQNGSLAVLNFAEDSRLDRERLHVYRVVCRAWNSVGVIVSPVVHVRPVVPSQYQMYTIQLMDVFTPVGNTAVFHCNINPYFMPEFVQVVTWQEENADLTSGGRYSILDHGDLKNGKLHVRNVSVADSYKKFRCLTRNVLTGKERSSNPAHLIVIEASNSPPRVIDHVGSHGAQRGARVELPCVAIAIPAARYRWSKNGLPLAGRDFAEANPGETDRVRLVGGNLEIEDVHLDDAGEYRCVAENYIGHQGVSVRLSVTAPLSAHVEPQTQTVDSGKEATLVCHVSGHPVESVTWLKDGKVLERRDREGEREREGEEEGEEEGAHGHLLRIGSVGRSDAGMYQCVVQSGAGDVLHASAQVSLGAFSPLILNSMPSEYLDPGTRVSMACVAMGNPRPTITWYVDGERLPAGQHGDRVSVGQFVVGSGEVVGHVNVTGLRVQDGGRYECEAANEMGSQRQAATLSVFGIPQIKPMKNITALAGSELEVICRVTGYPVKEISWKKGNLLLPTNHRQSTLANGSLLVSRLNRHLDEGWYSCHVINPNDQGMERKFYVRVIEPPKIDPFSFPPRKQGDRVSVSCSIGSGDLPMTLEWRKDGDVIDPDLGIQVHQSGPYSSFLSIEYATPRHNGNYTCIVTNEGATANHTSLMHINVPPTWIAEPEDTSSVLGGRAVIHCQAFGDPEPTVVWKKSVGGITGSYLDMDLRDRRAMTHHGNGSLVVETVAKEDQGFYLCHASNNIAPDLSKVVHLTVHVPATFTTHDSNLSVAIGDAAHLECLADGDLPTTLTWSSSSHDTFEWKLDPRYQVTYFPTDKGQGSRLTINHVRNEDSGFYICMAKNSYGSDVSSVHLLVLQSPDPPLDLVGSAGVDWVELKWKDGFNGNSKIVEYLVEICREKDSWKQVMTSLEVVAPLNSMRVENLKPSTRYKARVRARNSVGFGEPSEGVAFETLEMEPSSPPVNVTAVAVGSQSVLVTWQPVPKSHANGQILGYTIGYKKTNSTSPYLYVTTSNANQRQLDDLEKFSIYSIHVQAFNRKGSGPRSDDLVVSTLEDVPSHAPVNVMASSHSPETISVSWNPPPAYTLNGVLLGFKVVYKFVREDEDESDSMSQTTDQRSILLADLMKWTNYSVQVLAYTKIGEGVASPPIHVVTLEDVPGPPEEPKAVVMNSSSAVIVWKRPRATNGRLVRYFINVTQLGVDKAAQQIEVPPETARYLLTPLELDRGYAVRVGATTSAGDGEMTKEIVVRTLDKAGAMIAGHSTTLNFQWRNTVSLDCLAGGIPEPTITWEKDGINIGTRDPSGKVNVETKVKDAGKGTTTLLGNGTLVIDDIKGADAGEYRCTARNAYGADHVTSTLAVQASPSPPILTLTSATFNSIQVTWKTTSNGGSKIRGFRLFKKYDGSDWSYVDLDPSNRSHLFTDLRCGSGHSFYIQAFNRLGVGLPSEVVPAKTEGSAPIIPPQSMILDEVNSTSVTLKMNTWESGGCPISSFDVAYQVAEDKDWRDVRKGILPNVTTFSVTLNPGTWYVMKVTAHNDAGSTECLLRFTTLAYQGGSTVEPQHLVRRVNDISFISMVQKLHVVVPAAVALAVVVVVVAVAVGLFCYRRKNLKEEEKANNGLEVAMVVDDEVTGDQNDTNEFESERRERPRDGKRPQKTEEQNLLQRGISKETKLHAVIIESEREQRTHRHPTTTDKNFRDDDDDDDYDDNDDDVDNDSRDDNDVDNVQWYAHIPRDGFPDGSELQTAKNSSDDLHRFLKYPQAAQGHPSVSPSSCTCNGMDSGHSTMVTTSGRSSGGESYRALDPSLYGQHHHHHHLPQQYPRHQVAAAVQNPGVNPVDHRDPQSAGGSKFKDGRATRNASPLPIYNYQPGRAHHHDQHHHHHHHQQHPHKHLLLQDVAPVSIHPRPDRCGVVGVGQAGCRGCGEGGSLYAQLTCTCSLEERGFSPMDFPGAGQKRISRESETNFPPPPSNDYLSQHVRGYHVTPSDSLMTSPSSAEVTPASEEFAGSPFRRRDDVVT